MNPAKLNPTFPGTATLCLLLLGAFDAPLPGQIALHPARVAPASMERFALHVASGTESTERISILLPDAVSVLGVEPSNEWSFSVSEGTDAAAASIVWSGGPLRPGEYREFAFFGRLAGDVKRQELIFPVTLTRVDGDQLEYSNTGGIGPPPTVMIVGSTAVTPWGAVGVAGLAMAIAIIALGLSASRPRSATTPS